MFRSLIGTLRKVSIGLFIFNTMLPVVNRQLMNFAADVASRRSDEAVFIKSMSTSPFCCVRFSPQKRASTLEDEHALSWSNRAPMLFSSSTPIHRAKSLWVASLEKFKLGIAKGIELSFDQLFAELTHGWVYRTLRSVSSHQSPRNLICECVRLVRTRASRAFDRSQEINNVNNDKNREFANYKYARNIFSRLLYLIIRLV